MTPSTGTFSPGRTRNLSPTFRLSICDLMVGAVIIDKAGGFGRQFQQRLDRPGRRLAGAELQHLAKQHKDGDHCGASK